MGLINIIEYSLGAIFSVLLGYRLFLSASALKARKMVDFKTASWRKFAIVIPAHNEENVISKTLYSLSGLVYPKSLYDIIVIADHCSDNTMKKAQSMGAFVLERTNEREIGKEYALYWGMKKILERQVGYDAFVIFEPDGLVSGNYLEVMNYYLEQGSKVIQGCSLALPSYNFWSEGISQISVLLNNYIKPLGQKTLGLEAELNGNGMCFAADLIRHIISQPLTSSKDFDYGLFMLVYGIAIDFAPEANVWSQTEKYTNCRKYWYRSRYPVIKRYVPEIFKMFLKKREFKYIDIFLNLITPPLSHIAIVVIGFWLLNIILWISGWLSFPLLEMWFGITLLGLLTLFIGLYAVGADKQMYKSVLNFPLHLLRKVRSKVKADQNKSECEWVGTPDDL